MAELTSILRDIRGLYSDRGRDRLPDGSVWELTDWIPEILQAGARQRGRWLYQSNVLANPIDGMIYAQYRQGPKLLAAEGTELRNISITTVGDATGPTIPLTVTNPVFFLQRVVVPAANGTSPAVYVTYDGTTLTPASGPAAAVGKYGTTWKQRLVLANSASFPYRLVFSKVGDPATWNGSSWVDTSYDVTGLAAMANQILAFHASSVERIRGTQPPDSQATNVLGDLYMDTLFDRAGCYDSRSIVYWNNNVLFCDARGIWLTDGSAVRNLTQQGGIQNLWRAAWERPSGTAPLTTAGAIHYDYYLITIRHTGYPPITFAIDLSTRRAFMLSNLDCSSFAFATGARERLYGVDQKTKRVTNLSQLFVPDPTVLQVDEDGTPVLPVLATAWMQMSKVPSFKRIQDAHLTYETVTADDTKPEVFRLFYVNAPNGADQLLREFRDEGKYVRNRMAVDRRLPGIAFRLQQLVPTKDSRLYDLSLRSYAEEESDL